MTDPLLLATFQQRFAADPDPWQFETSAYERDKRHATIAACGPQRRAHTLELGAANGVLASALCAISDQLVAIEAVPAAAALAEQRLVGQPGARIVTGMIPTDVPSGPFDLIVASEILYYLRDHAYRRTLAAVPHWLAPGGRLVAVHWRPTSAERPRAAADVHRDLHRMPQLVSIDTADTADYLLSILERPT